MPAMRSQRWIPISIIMILPLILFWPLVFGGRVLYWGTPLLQFYPWRKLAVDMIRSGHVPLWNHYLGNGKPLVRERRVYAIDTGCCHGGRLTALILPSFRLVSVASRANYWLQSRQQYALFAPSAKASDELDWILLKAYAAVADDDELPSRMRERALECAALLGRCDQLAQSTCEQVRRLAERILDRLDEDGNWHTLPERQQAALYAREAGQHPLAPLLFMHRKRSLVCEDVYRVFKTPRQLLRAAGALRADGM